MRRTSTKWNAGIMVATLLGLASPGGCASDDGELTPDLAPEVELGRPPTLTVDPDDDPGSANATALALGEDTRTRALLVSPTVPAGACEWYALTPGTGGLFVRIWITVLSGDADLYVLRKAANGSWDQSQSVGPANYEQVDVVALDTQPIQICVYGAGSGGATYAIGAAATGTIGSPITAGDMYHAAGSDYHRPLNTVDDTFALDLNRPGGADDNETVAAVLEGQVVEVDPTRGYVRVAHDRPLWFRGVRYNRFYTGYLHMESLRVSVGQQVAVGAVLGEVGGMPCTNGVCAFPQHLHFTVYVDSANRASGPAYLRSLDVADSLGGPFRPISLAATAVGRLAEPSGHGDAGTAVYRIGSGTLNVDGTLGQGGSVHYASTLAASNLVIQWALGNAPSAGSYRVEAFVSRRHGSTVAAKYNIYVNGTLVATKTVSQLALSDAYTQIASLTLVQGDAVVVTEGNATSDPGREIAFDGILLRRIQEERRVP